MQSDQEGKGDAPHPHSPVGLDAAVRDGMACLMTLKFLILMSLSRIETGFKIEKS